MSRNNDELIRKVVGKLISVLHGEYSDTRDLAVVQLALLGKKAVPHLCSYLRKEADMENDLMIYHEMYYQEEFDDSFGFSVKLPLEKWKTSREFRQHFKEKWKLDPHTNGEINISGRDEAVERALEALKIIGDPSAIKTLEKLPLYDYQLKRWVIREKNEYENLTVGRTPLFEKAKETIEKLRA